MNEDLTKNTYVHFIVINQQAKMHLNVVGQIN